MSKPTELEAKGAFEVHQSILNLKKQMGMAFVELGRLLKKVRDEGYFQVLGYESFSAYVINSELGFKRRTAYYYIEIYEWYVEKLAYEAQYLAEIGQDKLLRALPMIKLDYARLTLPKLRERAEELMTEVQELRPVDFEKKYHDEPKQDGYEDYLAPPEYFRCDCHGKWRIIVPTDDCCPEFLKEFYQQLKRRFYETI